MRARWKTEPAVSARPRAASPAAAHRRAPVPLHPQFAQQSHRRHLQRDRAARRSIGPAGSRLVICDEPYRPLTFDGAVTPEARRAIFDRAVIAWSWSKAMAIPGSASGTSRCRRTFRNRSTARRMHRGQPHSPGSSTLPAIWQWVCGRPDATVDVRPISGETRPALRRAAIHGLRRPAPRAPSTRLGQDADPRRHRLHRPAAAGGASWRSRASVSAASGLHAASR